MPTKLIPTDSPLYLRRLAREVTHTIRCRSVYLANGHRVWDVVCKDGSCIIAQTSDIKPVTISASAAAGAFTDGNGQTLCASREPRRKGEVDAKPRAGSRMVITADAPDLTITCTDPDGHRATIRWACNDEAALRALAAALSHVSAPVAVECDADYDGAPR